MQLLTSEVTTFPLVPATRLCVCVGWGDGLDKQETPHRSVHMPSVCVSRCQRWWAYPCDMVLVLVNCSVGEIPDSPRVRREGERQTGEREADRERERRSSERTGWVGCDAFCRLLLPGHLAPCWRGFVIFLPSSLSLSLSLALSLSFMYLPCWGEECHSSVWIMQLTELIFWSVCLKQFRWLQILRRVGLIMQFVNTTFLIVSWLLLLNTVWSQHLIKKT